MNDNQLNETEVRVFMSSNDETVYNEEILADVEYVARVLGGHVAINGVWLAVSRRQFTAEEASQGWDEMVKREFPQGVTEEEIGGTFGDRPNVTEWKFP